MTRAHRLLRSLAVVALALPVAVAGPAATSTAAEDPALDQQISRGQATAADRVVRDRGHMDIGPRFVDGDWVLQAHDDSRRPAVWRDLADVVLAVGDEALLTVPDDPAYAFLQQEPGTQLHVVPQTQNADVVWIGWNTQDPETMDRVNLGVTLTLRGVQGPGDLLVYLQSGNFGAPQVLWDSTTRTAQDIWVDVNTHTHANWVFSRPGVYLVDVEATAELRSGQTVTARDQVRLAVGDDVRPREAFAADYDTDQSFTEAAPEGDGSREPEASADDPSGLSPLTVAGTVALLLALLVAALLTGRRTRRAKAAARAEVRP